MKSLQTSKRLTPERLLLALVAVTIAVLFLHQPLLETRLLITPGAEAFRFELDSDVQDGGNTITQWLDRDRLRWRCQLDENFDYPFCGMQIHFADHHLHGIDLTNYSHFNLRLHYQGDARTVRVFLRNAHPAYTKADEIRSTKHNMVEMSVGQGPDFEDVKLAYFRVADWWLLLYPVQMEHTTIDFSNVSLIEIQTGSGLRSGEHVFALDALELVGTRFSTEHLYLAIIIVWILIALTYLAVHIHALQQAVRSGKLRQEELTEINVLLDQRSRTLEEKIKKDPLTGAYNRAGIEDSLTSAFHAWKYKERPLSLLLLDVDHFKTINDRYGHSVGDEVLRELSSLVSDHIRSDDHFARWGGEEFILVCGNTALAQAKEIAEQLRELISEHRFAGHLQVTVSIGVAQLQRRETLEGLFIRTDRALYRAKDKGRNRVESGTGALRDAQRRHSDDASRSA